MQIRNPDGSAFAAVAVPPCQGDSALEDREAEADAASVARTGFIDTVERVEQMWQRRVGHAGSMVAHLDMSGAAMARHRYRHLRALRGVEKGVVQHVLHRTLQHGRLAEHDHGRGCGQLDAVRMPLPFESHVVYGRGEQGGEIQHLAPR